MVALPGNPAHADSRVTENYASNGTMLIILGYALVCVKQLFTARNLSPSLWAVLIYNDIAAQQNNR